MITLSLVGVFLSHYFYGIWHSHVVVDRLQQHSVHCNLNTTPDLPWYEWLPGIPQRRVVRSVYLTPDSEVAASIKLLQSAQVEEVEYYRLTLEQLRCLSKVTSIKVLRTRSYVNESHALEIQRFQIREFWVEGSDNNPTRGALEQLFKIPSLQLLGTAHGSSAVPEKLQQNRPDIQIEQTDFPA